MPENNQVNLKKSLFQKSLEKDISQCLICERKCIIPPGKTGYCKTRLNKNGIIYTIEYGCVPAISLNPIEKKPFYHFHPGTIALTIGTYGCNFDCFWCQNNHISHPKKEIQDLVKNSCEYLSPEQLIEIAIQKKCQGTSISFNEPTLLFEYSLDIFNLAKKEGLYNTYVSNGYMTEQVLEKLISSGLDAINIDIKGDAHVVKKYCEADVEKIWRNAKIAVDSGVHVEITTLIIEGLNSDVQTMESLSSRIYSELGEFTPFHISRFFPHYKSKEYGYSKPTSIELLMDLYDVAKKSGLKYVYLGNMPNTSHENTICPKCGNLIIVRKVFGIKELKVDAMGKCIYCGFPICKR